MEKQESQKDPPNGHNQEQESRPLQNPFFTSYTPEKKTWRSSLVPFFAHLKRPKDLKILLRCSLCVWIMSLFIVINPTLTAYGQATFFGAILLFINPPAGILFINILGGATAIIGMCCAWAWGAITMKASQATRSTAETNALLLRLEQQAVALAQNTEQASGQSNYAQVLIFEGFALDTRVVLTNTIMLSTFVYLVARLRVRAPKFILFEIFGIIITDLYLTIGPLVPTFSGTLAQLLVKPAATAVAISWLSSILIFPESTSHAVLSGYEIVLSPMKAFIDACKLSFEHHPVEFDVDKLEATRGMVLGAYKGVEASLGFLPLDFSICRWGTDDIISLKQPLEQVIIMCLGLLQLQSSRTVGYQRIKKFEHVREVLEKKAQYDSTAIPKHGHSQLMQSFELSQRFPRDQESKLFGKSMRSLADSSGPIMLASAKALDAIIEGINDVNTKRWFKRPTAKHCEDLRGKHHLTLEQLAKCRIDFAAQNTEHLLDHHLHLFNEHGRLRLIDDKTSNPIRGLLFALVLEERILSLADALHGLLDRIVELEQQRYSSRLWWPRGLSKAFAWALDRDPAPTGASPEGLEMVPSLGGEDQKTATSDAEISKKTKGAEYHSAEHDLQVLRMHGGKQRHGFSRFIVAAAGWLSSDEGLYAFRVLLVTIALTLPAVIKHSAGFFYRERGLWALIMSQTGMVLFTADFVSGLLQRVTGTIVGGALGMVCWYIGAGSGPGNPYGMAAIMSVAIIIVMYCRLFAPAYLAQTFILGGASMYLVLGYSWDDTHIPSYGNPGIGYSVFWRRTLLVIIGFGASAIVTFFPRPPSATRDVATTLARSLRTGKDVYALLLSTWNAPPDDLSSVVTKTNIATGQSIGALPGHIAMLKFEFSTSNLDPGTLAQTTKLCTTIMSNLTQLTIYSLALTPDLKMRFAHLTGINNVGFAGDIMAVLSLLEQALKTGDPLPAILPTPLLGRMIDIQDKAHAERVLSLTTIREENFRKYCAALNAWIGLLVAVDDCVLILKGALGEEHVVSAWDDDYFTGRP